MNRVIIDRNPFEVSEGSRSEFETEDVLGLIKRELPEWPPSARLYYDGVAAERDITPLSEADIEAIKSLEGTFHVVVYPGLPPVGVIVANLIIAAILTAASYFLTPKLSAAASPADRQIDDASPNNALSARTNEARPNGRIPDIYGTVRSTPDLLMVPSVQFEDHEEVEYAYMCIGRGAYNVSDVRDGNTPIEDIPGASIEVYGPDKSPNSGDAPQLQIGDAIGGEVVTVAKLSAVNGQVLEPTNSRMLKDAIARFRSNGKIDGNGDDDFDDYFLPGQSDGVIIAGATFDNSASRTLTGAILRFDHPNEIRLISGGDFTEHFIVGRNVSISGATTDGLTLNGSFLIAGVTASILTLSNPAAVNPDWGDIDDLPGQQTSQTGDATLTTPLVSGDLSGTYTLTSVTAIELDLSNPAAVNSDWNKLLLIPDGRTDFLSDIDLTPVFDRRIGPFRLPGDNITGVTCNFIALNGLYRDNGVKQSKLNLQIEVQLRKIADNGAVLVDWETFTGTILGSAVSRSTRALTMHMAPAAGAGIYEIRTRQESDHNFNFAGTIVDELKWRDCYSNAPISEDHFGNVTTIWTKTKATQRALALKNRQLNLLATRRIPRRSGGGFTDTLHPTSDFDLILYAVALDPYIGRRTVAELDLTQIDAVAESVRDYFGDDELASFNYTFDKTGMSFEETALAICSAAFCQPYRQGNKMRIAFERENEDSSLLFNHRNKVPKSEVRTYRFGNVKDFDGIEFNYIDPADDAIETYYIPTDRSATAPKKIDSIGIRNHKQPYVHAWREWNKMIYQRESTKFDALSEAELLVPSDRILVSDNTRPDTMDGEVVSQSSLTLTLSQVAALDTGATGYAAFNAYHIFLQHTDGTVETIGIKQGATTKEVLLENAPAVALSLDPQNSVRTGYVIIKSDDPRTSAFLVTERESAKDRFIFPVTAINYDVRYYEEDLNFPV